MVVNVCNELYLTTNRIDLSVDSTGMRVENIMGSPCSSVVRVLSPKMEEDNRRNWKWKALIAPVSYGKVKCSHACEKDICSHSPVWHYLSTTSCSLFENGSMHEFGKLFTERFQTEASEMRVDCSREPDSEGQQE